MSGFFFFLLNYVPFCVSTDVCFSAVKSPKPFPKKFNNTQEESPKVTITLTLKSCKKRICEFFGIERNLKETAAIDFHLTPKKWMHFCFKWNTSCCILFSLSVYNDYFLIAKLLKYLVCIII